MSDKVLVKGAKRKIPVLSISRKVIQFVSFFLVNYAVLEMIFEVEFEPLKQILPVLPFLHSANNAWTAGAGLLEYTFYAISQGTIPYFFIGLIGVFGLLTGRIFCGWICPTGFIQDLFAGLGGEGRKISIEADSFLKKVKQFILVVMLVLIVPLGYYAIKDPNRYLDYALSIGSLSDNPTGIFSLSEFLFSEIPAIIEYIVEEANLEILFGEGNWRRAVLFFVYLIILGLSVVFPRFYCRYLCPYASVISLFSDYSLLKLSRLPTRCPGRKECGACERVCPMQIRILDESYGGFTGNGECILCMDCLQECNNREYNAIKLRMAFGDKS